MMETRRRTKGLGGRELTLSEARAVRTVLGKMNRASEDELAAMDADIHRMEASELLDDLESLRPANEGTVSKLLVRPSARLSHDETVHIDAWLNRVEFLQSDHRELLHVGQLLQPGCGADAVLRELNLGFLHLHALVNLEDHVRRNLIDPDTTLPHPNLLNALAEMEQRAPLAGHLTTASELDAARPLGELPLDRVQRAALLHVYCDYIELSVIANAFSAGGSLQLPRAIGATSFPGYQELMRMASPLGYSAVLLEDINERLISHLAHGGRA